MEIKINKDSMKERRYIHFSELNVGNIFRHRLEEEYQYCLKVSMIDLDGEEYNCVDLEDGNWYDFDPDANVEIYDDVLELKEDSFIAKK